eukprot:CFRG5498T1
MVGVQAVQALMVVAMGVKTIQELLASYQDEEDSVSKSSSQNPTPDKNNPKVPSNDFGQENCQRTLITKSKSTLPSYEDLRAVNEGTGSPEYRPNLGSDVHKKTQECAPHHNSYTYEHNHSYTSSRGMNEYEGIQSYPPSPVVNRYNGSQVYPSSCIENAHTQQFPQNTPSRLEDSPSAPPFRNVKRAPSPPPRARHGSVPDIYSMSAGIKPQIRDKENPRSLHHTSSDPVSSPVHPKSTNPSSTKSEIFNQSGQPFIMSANMKGYVSYKFQRINTASENAPGKWMSYWAEVAESCMLLYPLRPGTEKTKCDRKRNVPKYIRLQGSVITDDPSADSLGNKFIFVVTNQRARTRHSFYVQTEEERARWHGKLSNLLSGYVIRSLDDPDTVDVITNTFQNLSSRVVELNGQVGTLTQGLTEARMIADEAVNVNINYQEIMSSLIEENHHLQQRSRSSPAVLIPASLL